MLDIADWLEKLGMSEYLQRFVDNKIDSAVKGIAGYNMKDQAAASEDGEFLRRVMLDIVGYPPNLDQVKPPSDISTLRFGCRALSLRNWRKLPASGCPQESATPSTASSAVAGRW